MIIEIGPNAVAMDAAGLAEFLDVLDAEIAEAEAKAKELAGQTEARKITKLTEEGDDGKF